MEGVQIYDLQEKQEELTRWLNLSYEIAELEQEKATFSSNYYQEHSFYSHIIYDDYRGIISEAPRVDEVAINLADTYLVMDRHIKRIKEQQTLFNDCLARLPTKEVQRLRTHYSDDNNGVRFTEFDKAIYNLINDIKKLTESNERVVRIKYQKKLNNRMENINGKL